MTTDLLALRDWLVEMEVTLVGMESTGVYWKCVFVFSRTRWSAGCSTPGTCATSREGRPMWPMPNGFASWSSTGWCGPPSWRPKRSESYVTSPATARRRSRNAAARRNASTKCSRTPASSSRAWPPTSWASPAATCSRRWWPAPGPRGPRRAGPRGDAQENPPLRRALEGRFSAHHALIVGQILAKLDFLDEAIGTLSGEIDRVIAPFEAEVALLDTVPGVDRRIAECLIAEIGTDMGRFETSARLASWAGMCPGNHESGGKRKSGRARKGSKWLAANLAQAAEAAGRSKDTYLGAQFARLRGRIGHPKARKVVEHSILVAAFHVLAGGVPYADLGADWFQRRRPEAHARRLAHQIEALGYRVTIEAAEAA